jgi:hypothetical protein
MLQQINYCSGVVEVAEEIVHSECQLSFGLICQQYFES